MPSVQAGLVFLGQSYFALLLRDFVKMLPRWRSDFIIHPEHIFTL